MAFQRNCAENYQLAWVLSDREAEYIRTKDDIEEVIESDVQRKYMKNQ